MAADGLYAIVLAPKTFSVIAFAGASCRQPCLRKPQ